MTTWRRPFNLLTMLHILSDGPSFRPMYFIIMSEVSSSSALPSISCQRERERERLDPSNATSCTLEPVSVDVSRLVIEKKR